MNTYETWVTGVTGRRLTIQAENQKDAEIEAMRKFTALVDTDGDVEVVDITRVDDGEDEDDWREDFWEVRVFASKPIEFTVTVKADDQADAIEEASRVLAKMTDDDIVAHDNYDEAISYDSDEWHVLNVEESHGFENTKEDLKLAKECAWNVEDES